MTTLLLHGLGGSRAQPLTLFSPIVPVGEEVLALDVRAHGEDDRISGEAASFSLAALADDVAERVRASVGSSPLTVIGISMGAGIALRLALAAAASAPGALSIDRLVFVRPAFTDVPLPPNLVPFPVIGELLTRLGAVEGEREFLRTALYRQALEESPLGAEGLLEQFRSPGAAARARRLIEIPRSVAFDDSESLASITVPTAIVWAPRDPVHPVSVAELWMDELDGAASIPLPARDDGYGAYVRATRAGVGAWLGW
ncbi:alpha/beta hydrolase [Herbiconiux sp. CPCC 205716]|uniref:Alpha/beta hydrolase n=1 Tax=Herbiconiux gentiana TaxID=2970912 RepID=A0ABT2GCB6_9MICO|nr:alpha/beta hydrolase [Herbiconiux gentiana]MCS5713861.1 alpha/beta hydrolase [Herbiconiux gentiana]